MTSSGQQALPFQNLSPQVWLLQDIMNTEWSSCLSICQPWQMAVEHWYCLCLSLWQSRLHSLEAEVEQDRRLGLQLELVKKDKARLLSQLTAQESVIDGLRAERRIWGQELAQQGGRGPRGHRPILNKPHSPWQTLTASFSCLFTNTGAVHPLSLYSL